jgi:hypothetical protein
MKQMSAAFLIAAAVAAHPLAQEPAQAAADVLGTWAITTVSPISETTNNMEIAKDGDKLHAVAKGDAGDLPYDKAELKGNEVTLVLTIDYQGSPMTITYTGVVDGKKMAGDADFGGLAQGTWSAVKK